MTQMLKMQVYIIIIIKIIIKMNKTLKSYAVYTLDLCCY